MLPYLTLPVKNAAPRSTKNTPAPPPPLTQIHRPGPGVTFFSFLNNSPGGNFCPSLPSPFFINHPHIHPFDLYIDSPSLTFLLPHPAPAAFLPRPSVRPPSVREKEEINILCAERRECEALVAGEAAITPYVLGVIISSPSGDFWPPSLARAYNIRVGGRSVHASSQAVPSWAEMAEEHNSAGAGFWLPDEFLDDDFFSDEKAAAAAVRSDSDEEDGLGGLSRRVAGLDCDGGDRAIPKVGFRFLDSRLVASWFGLGWDSCLCLEASDCFCPLSVSRALGGGDVWVSAVHALRAAGFGGGQPHRRRVAGQLAAVLAAGAAAGRPMGPAARGGRAGGPPGHRQHPRACC